MSDELAERREIDNALRTTMKGFARVSVAVPVCRIADVDGNAQATLDLWRQADEAGSSVVVFPELGLPAYTLRDLFLDRHLVESCGKALVGLAREGKRLAPLAIVGVPLRVGSALYNSAALLHRGHVVGVVPKAYLPNYREFEERRWFQPGTRVPPGSSIEVDGRTVPFGLDVLFEADGVSDLVVGVEICEDLWVPVPPSARQALAGATVCVNLSASNFLVGKRELRRLLALSASDRGKCAYLYVAAGPGESSTDLAFDSDAFICENGRELGATERFSREPQLLTRDIDLELLIGERLSTTSFGDCASVEAHTFRRVAFHAKAPRGLARSVSPHPFLPSDEATLTHRCFEIFEIQTNALVTRLESIDHPKLVLGLSGGVDSAHAALVCAAALDLQKRPRTELWCVTMPGLGTTRTTQANAEALAQSLGASLRVIGIEAACGLVLRDTGHPAARYVDDPRALIQALRSDPALADVTLENVQARLRTLVLMTLANQERGIVIGTGDLSEKALGWATYAGDQIAMYDVNAGVPKTLIQFVMRWVARDRAQAWVAGDTKRLREALEAILATPISPELLPIDAAGRIGQLTEEKVGPYELHDFFLFHFVRHGSRPGRILDLARVAFAGRYDVAELKRWLKVFLERFFANQFKRSCTADAPKVGMVALSPRADWRMPSDALVAGWLSEAESYEPSD